MMLIRLSKIHIVFEPVSNEGFVMATGLDDDRPSGIVLPFIVTILLAIVLFILVCNCV